MSSIRRLLTVSAVLVTLCCSCASSMDRSAAMDAETGNVCETNRDCGEGSCVSGHCKARGSWVKRVLVEATPLVSVTTGEYGDIRYLQEHQVGSASTLDIELDVVANLNVAIRPPQPECVFSRADSSGYLPIRLSVYQDTRISGISVALTAGESGAIGAETDKGNQVLVSLAPGPVDLYIDPNVIADDGSSEPAPSDACDIAPVLVRSQNIAAGRVLFEQSLAPARHVDVDVRTKAGDSGQNPFEGWVLDMVEPVDGRRISSRRVLAGPSLGSDGRLHYQVRLAYNDVLGVDSEKTVGTELFRLTPPNGTLAPKHFIARSALDLFGASSVVLPEEDTGGSPVVVHGHVEAAEGGKSLPADIIAELEPGSNASTGIIAQFQAAATSDEQGRFTVELVPGTYRVTAVPKDGTTYALQTSNWTVAPTPSEQSGRLIAIPASTSLAGVVTSQNQNQPLANATILAVPSSLGKRPAFLDKLLGQAAATGVRSQMGMADAEGMFDLPLDPGVYDVTVRPPEDSGYPWAVRPLTKIVETSQPLTGIQVGNPVAYSGKVTVPGASSDSPRAAMPGTLLRFFALFDENNQLAEPDVPAVSAVEIGQTRADSTGRYRLLLPDRLN